MTAKLTRNDLYTLEQYAQLRNEFRARVMAHKQARRLALGANANLYFEDQLTVRYQVQEMLRIEKIFEAEDIEEELAAYNPLIPDGHNWKATFMLEYDDPAERRHMLGQLVGVEDCVWLRVGSGPLIAPVCDEDLERATATKTSSVHFMRFELSPEDISALRQDAEISAGISHAAYTVQVAPVPAPLRQALAADIDYSA
ncbi:MAG: DUF3501 family protein [Gammaproteobacteria bacterium]|nr:DUF3501 family protein [Gammaproteobacteria bacterium]